MGRVATTFLLALALALPAALASSSCRKTTSRASHHLAVPSADKAATRDAATRDAIDDLIENIRRIICEGSEDPYIPVLDPLQLESQELNLNEIGAYAVKAGIRNLVSTGLGDFDAKVSYDLSVIFFRLTVTVDISVPHLDAQGQYSLDALVGEVVNLYGNGNFQIDVSELNATIVTVISIGFSSSKVQRLTTTLNVGDFKLSADGLMEGGPVDALFNLAVNQVAKVIFDSQKSVLEDYLASLLEDPINEVVKDIGLSDLLCLLLGNCGDGGGDGGNQGTTEGSTVTDSSEAGGGSNGGDDNAGKNGGAFADNVYNGAGVRDRLSK